MESLEQQQEKIINLGKLFVKELKLEPGVDTFSRWMAHYLAQKISLAQKAKGSQKEAAEKECFDVILKLWQHRHSLPSGKRPFESFEPILETLYKLNPDIEEPYFYNAFQDRSQVELKTDDLHCKSVEDWVSIVNAIDKTARIWIEYAIIQASSNAKNEETKEWIANAVNLSDNTDVNIINTLMVEDPLCNFEVDKQDDFSRKYDNERLKRRISELKKYSELNKFLLAKYEDQLENLSGEK